MERVFYLDDEYSPLGDGYYQPLYRYQNRERYGDMCDHEYEADSSHRWEVKVQLGLELDEDELKYYDPEERERPLTDEERWEIEGDKRYHEMRDQWILEERYA